MTLREHLAIIDNRLCFWYCSLLAGRDFDIPPIREESGHHYEEEGEGARAERMGGLASQAESLRTIGRGIVSTGVAVLGGMGAGPKHQIAQGEVRRQGLGYPGNYRKIE